MLQKPAALTIKLFFASLLLQIANGYFFELLNSYFHYNLTSALDNDSILNKLVIGVVAAPILETFVFQYLPNKLLVKMRVRSSIVLIMAPSVLFALAHVSYSWFYGLVMLLDGIILNYFFIQTKKLYTYAFWITALLHAIYNLISFFFI